MAAHWESIMAWIDPPLDRESRFWCWPNIQQLPLGSPDPRSPPVSAGAWGSDWISVSWLHRQQMDLLLLLIEFFTKTAPCRWSVRQLLRSIEIWCRALVAARCKFKLRDRRYEINGRTPPPAPSWAGLPGQRQHSPMASATRSFKLAFFWTCPTDGVRVHSGGLTVETELPIGRGTPAEWRRGGRIGRPASHLRWPFGPRLPVDWDLKLHQSSFTWVHWSAIPTLRWGRPTVVLAADWPVTPIRPPDCAPPLRLSARQNVISNVNGNITTTKIELYKNQNIIKYNKYAYKIS